MATYSFTKNTKGFTVIRDGIVRSFSGHSTNLYETKNGVAVSIDTNPVTRYDIYLSGSPVDTVTVDGNTFSGNKSDLRLLLQNDILFNDATGEGGDGSGSLTPEEAAKVAAIETTGSGDLFLANDGEYKAPPAGGVQILYATVSAMKAVRPTNGTVAITSGYHTSGDGGGAKYVFNSTSSATQDNGSVHTPTTGTGNGRWLLIVNENLGGINVRQFGAKGDGVTDDGAAILALFNYNKTVSQQIISTPNSRWAKGFSINFGYGKFLCSQTLPLVNGTHIIGGNGYANEDGNLCTVQYTGNTDLFTYSSYSGQWNPVDTVYDIDMRGIGFFGKPDLSTNFISPSSTKGSGIWTMYNSKIQHCGFRQFKKIDMFGIVLHFQWNYMNYMPKGALLLGGSDATISDCVVGGGSYVHNGVTYQADDKFTKLVHLNSFGNSRMDRMYITGSFGTPSPIPVYIENSFSSQFTDNWYDYSDGPNLQIRYSNNLVFRGGNLQGSNRNNPTTNYYGEHECAIFIGNSTKISIDKMIFREIPKSGDANFTADQVTVRTWASSDIVISDYIEARLNPADAGSSIHAFSLDAENGSSNVTSYALGKGIVPTGGSTGQVLSKSSASDRDVTWATPSAGNSISPTVSALNFMGVPFKSITVGFDVGDFSDSTNISDNEMLLMPLNISTSATITGIRIPIATSGVYVASDFNGVALYTLSNGVYTRVAISANLPNLWKTSANTTAIAPFTSPYVASAGIYYVGLCYNQSSQTTQPQMFGRYAPAFKALGISNGLWFYGVSYTNTASSSISGGTYNNNDAAVLIGAY